MGFRTRVFLLSFLPFALLLGGSFWAIQLVVQATVRDGLRSLLRENQLSIARLRSRTELENSRFLKIAGENAALKAGMQLLSTEPESLVARQTVEDQLSELCERMDFDFLMVSSPTGQPLAAVVRTSSASPGVGYPAISPVTGKLPESPESGLRVVREKLYQIATVPIDHGDENIGSMAVGEVFDFSGLHTPAVLLQNGRLVKSSIPGLSEEEAARAFRTCGAAAECNVRLAGADYLSLPLQTVSFGGGFELRSLQNVDAASGPVQNILRNVFVASGIAALLLALVFSMVASRSIVDPVTGIIAQLRRSERTGLLPEFEQPPTALREVKELTSSFNRAGAAIRDAQETLQRAYIEFVGSLANALDARDHYTAGHSRRVSSLSCSIAESLQVSAEEIDRIRIGALLHDIGKIGVSDSLLRKPERLTNEEFALIQQHPEIGRRILEGVHGFTPYLDAVEFHHENWDGTGYPSGQKNTETPLAARIIHVADAYDAMTTDRPYRNGMSHEQALRILQDHAGRQFDPKVVEVFAALPPDAIAVEKAREAALAEAS